MQIAARALVMGISLCGLVAAKVQEAGRPDLGGCISSPTWADLVSLERSVRNRTAIYSSADTVIAGRTSEWQRLARAYDVPWQTQTQTNTFRGSHPRLPRAQTTMTQGRFWLGTDLSREI
jgi:hypothetical protein